ncbi:MAG: DUF6503 family protein [Bacteroidia bacterium]
MKYAIILLSALSLCFFACSHSEQAPKETEQKVQITEAAPPPATKEITKADIVLNQAFEAHGGEAYNSAHYEFVFRKKQYTFHNSGSDFRYTVERSEKGNSVVDILDQNGFQRLVDGKPDTLSEKKIAGYTGSVNSVIYFVTLPHKLLDPAVNLRHQGRAAIAGKDYDVLEVYFDEEGGGTDHDDEFYYWINSETHLIDYLAYSYRVNGGGVRFRSAYNPRTVDGIVFQDYVNYKAPVGTHLAELPGLFEEDKLEKLSLIETEDVRSLKGN